MVLLYVSSSFCPCGIPVSHAPFADVGKMHGLQIQLQRCVEALLEAEKQLQEAQDAAQASATAAENACAEHEAACHNAEYHDALSHLMKQAADAALKTLQHERKALVCFPAKIPFCL